MSAPANRAPFEGIYRENFARTWRWLRRLGVPERDLADAAQEVFVVVARKLGEYDHRRPIESWLYAICLRVASDRRRSAVARHELLVEGEEQVHEPNDSIESEYSERRALLEAALDAMSLEQRAVFTLFELEGHSGEEIAELVAVSLPTVHSRLRLAREIFRRTVQRVRARDRHELRRIGGGR